MWIEGRIISGLDEFMLRLGHLSMLLRVSASDGGTGRRLLRACAEVLERPVSVDVGGSASLAQYLATKKLCYVTKVTTEFEPKYPNLLAVRDDSGAWTLKPLGSGGLEVSWQDTCLSDPAVPSCVGAVKHASRGESKSPLSHILDWGEALELVTPNGEVTFAGRLAVALVGGRENPYVVGSEAVVYLWQLAKHDIDLWRCLIPRIAQQAGRMTKADARGIFVAAVEELSNVAEESPLVSASIRSRIYSQLRELELDDAGETRNSSTAWHRASSRFETFIDLGVLQKGDASEASKYKYSYAKTALIDAWSRSLETTGDLALWMRNEMLDAFVAHTASGTEGVDDERCIIDALKETAHQLASPSRVYPFDLLILGAVCNLLTVRRYVNPSRIGETLAEYIRADPRRGSFVASRTNREPGGVSFYI